ncbi:hypothetical protein A9W99_08825 [Mycobacterium sp. 1164966.3]|nr:hypothetical protein A9W99_08825 [Mycobacterium sp. 1164966.3]
MSGTNPVSDGNETVHAHEPHIHIEKGRPTDAELAALIAVLGCVGAASAEPAQPEGTRWGLPVDRLRFSMSNYQRLTLQQMTHMKQ